MLRSTNNNPNNSSPQLDPTPGQVGDALLTPTPKSSTNPVGPQGSRGLLWTAALTVPAALGALAGCDGSPAPPPVPTWGQLQANGALSSNVWQLVESLPSEISQEGLTPEFVAGFLRRSTALVPPMELGASGDELSTAIKIGGEYYVINEKLGAELSSVYNNQFGKVGDLEDPANAATIEGTLNLVRVEMDDLIQEHGIRIRSTVPIQEAPNAQLGAPISRLFEALYDVPGFYADRSSSDDPAAFTGEFGYKGQYYPYSVTLTTDGEMILELGDDENPRMIAGHSTFTLTEDTITQIERSLQHIDVLSWKRYESPEDFTEEDKVGESIYEDTVITSLVENPRQ